MAPEPPRLDQCVANAQQHTYMHHVTTMACKHHGMRPHTPQKWRPNDSYGYKYTPNTPKRIRGRHQQKREILATPSVLSSVSSRRHAARNLSVLVRTRQASRRAQWCQPCASRWCRRSRSCWFMKANASSGMCWNACHARSSSTSKVAPLRCSTRGAKLAARPRGCVRGRCAGRGRVRRGKRGRGVPEQPAVWAAAAAAAAVRARSSPGAPAPDGVLLGPAGPDAGQVAVCLIQLEAHEPV